MWLFALFVIVPLIEIALFIQIGGWLTLWPTLAIVVLTAILGTWLVRVQGLRTLARLQAALDRFENPTAPLAHGAMILFAGALLLTPGFLTDAIGLALLMPPVRVLLLRVALREAERRAQRRQPHAHPADARSGPRPGPIIDADFEELGPDERGPGRGGNAPGETGRGGSGWTRD